jgi:hypothetical protein
MDTSFLQGKKALYYTLGVNSTFLKQQLSQDTSRKWSGAGKEG